MINCESATLSLPLHGAGYRQPWCRLLDMPITAWVILLLALVLAPILLIRFRRCWVAAFNMAVTNRITGRFAARLPGFGILTQ